MITVSIIIIMISLFHTGFTTFDDAICINMVYIFIHNEMLNSLQEEHKINTAQLCDVLSEMESRLKIRDIELTKLKQHHKLMIKQLGGRRSDQSQQAEVVTQVEYLCNMLQNVVWKLYSKYFFSCVLLVIVIQSQTLILQ